MISWLQGLAYRKLLGTVLFPVSLVAPEVPHISKPVKRPPGEKIHLEIVSHCWQYSEFLAYQLSSLVHYPVSSLQITYTVFYSEEDTDTVALLQRFKPLAPEWVSWNFQSLPRTSLNRRGIGRNKAALATTADWVWFTDCDTVFHAGCLDSLEVWLRSSSSGMLYPSSERISEMLKKSDTGSVAQSSTEDVDRAPEGLSLLDTSRFEHNVIARAKGAYQIVRGDICRVAGYCNTIAAYQRPVEQWKKTYEDTVFRKLIGEEGTPVDIDALMRIRHIEKGRYAKSGPGAWVRKSLRQHLDLR